MSSSSPIFLARTVLLAINAVVNLYAGFLWIYSAQAFSYDLSAANLQSEFHLSRDLAIMVQLCIQLNGGAVHAFGWAYLYGAMTSNMKEQSPVLISGAIGKGLAAYTFYSAANALAQLNESAAIQAALSGLGFIWKWDTLNSTLFFVLYVAGHISHFKIADKKAPTTAEKKLK